MDIINVERRDPKSKAKQLRRVGIVPCSVYGGTLPEAVSIQMDQQTANQLFRDKAEGSKVQLRLDGEVIPTQIKEKTRNFDNHNIEHISFQALKAGHPVHSVVHIYRKNDENVHGTLEQLVHEVAYASLPRHMVDAVTLDLEGAGEGTLITLADIPELNNPNLELQLPLDTIVLRVVDNRPVETEEEAEE